MFKTIYMEVYNALISFVCKQEKFLSFIRNQEKLVSFVSDQEKLVSFVRERVKIVVPSVVVLIAGIFYFFSQTSSTVDPILKVVEVVTATPQSIEQKTRLIGVICAKHSTTLVAKGFGVLEVLKKAGETVTKGTLIARVSNPYIEKKYEFALSSVQIAKDQYERAKSLTKTGTSSKQAAEEKQSILLEAERNLATAEIERDKIRFYAPFNGIIGAYKERDGTEIKEGSSLVTFYDPTGMIAKIDIPAPLLASVNVGQKVTINGKRYLLTEVQKMLDENTHMAPAVVDIESDGSIVGMPVDVELTVFERNNVIVLPDDAVFLEQGKSHVYVIKKSKTVLTPVELGLRAREMVEITKGLVPGDVVVSQGQGRLSDDLMVKIYDPKQDQTHNTKRQKSREKLNELNRIFH